MALMTLGSARALALTLYYAATGKHDLDDHQFNVILDTLNKKYWMQAVRGLGSLLAVDSLDTSTASDGSLDTSGTLLNADGVFQTLAVEVKFLGRYITLDYEIIQDRYQYNIAFGQVQALIPTAWTLLGEKILLLPKMNGPVPLRVTYIPNVGDLTTDSQVLLSGKLPSFHQLIPYEAAALLAPRDADRSLPATIKEMKDSFNDYLQSRQRQGGRKIRFVAWD
jgi:hypothetical protein